MIALSLPFPPSVNSLYNFYKGRWLLSKEGRNYHTRIIMLCRKLLGPPDPIKGRVRVGITMYPPDERRRDLDNTLKGLLDSIVKARVIHDDSQIDDLRIVRGERKEGGEIAVQIEEIV